MPPVGMPPVGMPPRSAHAAVVCAAQPGSLRPQGADSLPTLSPGALFCFSPALPLPGQALPCVRILWRCLRDADSQLTSVGCGFFPFARLPPSPRNPSTKLIFMLADAVGFSWLLSVLFLLCRELQSCPTCPETPQSGEPRADSTLGQCWPRDLQQAVCFPEEVAFQDSIWSFMRPDQIRWYVYKQGVMFLCLYMYFKSFINSGVMRCCLSPKLHLLCLWFC